MSALPDGITEEDVFLVLPKLRQDPDIRVMVESMCRGVSVHRSAVLRYESRESDRSMDCLSFHAYSVRDKIASHFRPSVDSSLAELRREGKTIVDLEIMNSLTALCKSKGINVQKKFLVTIK
jgi:hypothetical protein